VAETVATDTVTTRHDKILPTVVAHADWGKDRRKRQVATARLGPPASLQALEPREAGSRGEPSEAGSGEPRYVVESLAAAPDAGESAGGRGLLHDLRATALPGQLLIGFDFPIGLPLAYASSVGIASFPGFLGAIGSPPWEEFDVVARRPDEITLHRPFYPDVPGGAKREHLRLGLGLTAKELRRRCEGNDAEVLFWTLGSKQVGKGALTGWKLLAGAQRDAGLAIWPFAGSLAELLDGGSRVVVAETYPREYYKYARTPGTARTPDAAGPTPGAERPMPGAERPMPGAERPPPSAARTRWSKRRRADRLALAPGILAWARSLGVGWNPQIRGRVAEGFSDGPIGEDEFDAVIGLLAMISVVTGALSSGEPCDDPAVATVEGWILGRSASSLEQA
jgi:hypothetical protein